MKKLFKQLTNVIRTLVRSRRLRSELHALERDAFSALATHKREKPLPRTGNRLLLVPCDPWTLMGSKGDEAMITAVVVEMRALHPDLEVSILAVKDRQINAPAIGPMQVITGWDGDFKAVLSAAIALQPTHVVVIGADVLDGYYSPLTAAKMLCLGQVCCATGAKGCTTGFSFNKTPNPLLGRHFLNASRAGLVINLRDPVSLRRFQAAVATPAQLVADVAFLLEPPDTESDLVQQAHAWADAQRTAHRKVLGFNIHPMLLRHASPADIQSWIAAATAGLHTILASQDISVLLIPHDIRDGDGDNVCLAPVAKQFEGHPFVLHLAGQPSAAELKAVAGGCDMVVSARMHLTIAALGMGKPVACVTYQDKFQGLLEHFSYPTDLMLSPTQLVEDGRLATMMSALIARTPELTSQVVNRLPAVKALAAANINPLRPQI